ncbi:MAG TPA: alpha/beta hydrolase [Catenuloplanes sp.]|jgi:pimeloyl-ACP methyl ester carboxylesterase
MISDSLIDAGEVTIAARDFGGSGGDLLLLHGAGSNLADMTVLARGLRARHRVVAVDLRGHGRSGDGPWRWDAVLADVSAAVEQLSLTRPAVVGLSLGGMVAALWGHRHPDGAGVVSLDGNPPPTRPDQLPGLPAGQAAERLAQLHDTFTAMAAAATEPLTPTQVQEMLDARRALAQRFGADERLWVEGFRRGLGQRDGATFLRPYPELLGQLRTAMNDVDLMPVYADTQCPTLLVLATRDVPQQEPFADLYAAYRRGVAQRVEAIAKTTPWLQFLHLEGASHAMVAEQPHRLAALIGEFLTAR